MKTIKQITEELYPDACGDSYCPDDVANEGRTMQISWRMAGAIHSGAVGEGISNQQQLTLTNSKQ